MVLSYFVNRWNRSINIYHLTVDDNKGMCSMIAALSKPSSKIIYRTEYSDELVEEWLFSVAVRD